MYGLLLSSIHTSPVCVPQVHDYTRFYPLRMTTPFPAVDVDRECASNNGTVYTNPKCVRAMGDRERPRVCMVMGHEVVVAGAQGWRLMRCLGVASAVLYVCRPLLQLAFETALTSP